MARYSSPLLCGLPVNHTPLFSPSLSHALPALHQELQQSFSQLQQYMTGSSRLVFQVRFPFQVGDHSRLRLYICCPCLLTRFEILSPRNFPRKGVSRGAGVQKRWKIHLRFMLALKWASHHAWVPSFMTRQTAFRVGYGVQSTQVFAAHICVPCTLTSKCLTSNLGGGCL